MRRRSISARLLDPTFRGIPSPAQSPDPGALLAYNVRTLPENIRELIEAHLDRCADWARGATLYDAAAGHPRFRAPTSTAVSPRVARQQPDPLPDRVPRWLAEVILRSMRKDRAKRGASMEELARALGAAL